MKGLTRISISISPQLLEEFDEVLEERGYENRSKGIRDALNDYIFRFQWMNEMEGERVGLIAVIYDYHSAGVLEDLNNVQQEYKDYINSVMHFDLSEDKCMEVVVMKSDIEHIKKANAKIKDFNGVEKVMLTSAGRK